MVTWFMIAVQPASRTVYRLRRVSVLNALHQCCLLFTVFLRKEQRPPCALLGRRSHRIQCWVCVQCETLYLWMPIGQFFSVTLVSVGRLRCLFESSRECTAVTASL